MVGRQLAVLLRVLVRLMWNYHARTNCFFGRFDDPIPYSTPGAKLLSDGHTVVLPNRLDELQAIAMRDGALAPMPMMDYDWPIQPGWKPSHVQRFMANFAVLHKGAFILSEMRTGKTLSALWAADYLMRRSSQTRCLIVAQLSTLKRVWKNAIDANLLGRRRCVVLHGTAEKRLRALDSDADFYIVNYEGLNIGARRNSAQGKIEFSGFARAIRERTDIQIIIIDEASAYSDAQTFRHKVARQLLMERDYLWLLTGTPAPNEPTDAYGLGKLVNNSFGESFRSFKLRTMSQLSLYRWAAKPTAKDDVAKLLTPSIRFTQEECFDAPDCVTIQRDAPLSSEQLALCKELKKEMLLKTKTGSVIDAVNDAALRSKLLQIACGACYDDKHEAHHIDWKPRLKVLKEVISEAPKKVIVFAPFTSVVARIASEFGHSAIVVDGNVTGKARDDALSKFNDDPSVRVLVAHPGPVARGLDLTCAATVIWFAPTDRTEDYIQANQRINGPSQTHKMTIVQLSGTATEREIYKRLEGQMALQGAILQLIKEQL